MNLNSQDPRTMMGKMRRTKSTGVMPPANSTITTANSDTTSTSTSSPNSNSTTLSTSPSTPPKKAWERHYRTFLKKKTDEGNDQQQQLHQQPNQHQQQHQQTDTDGSNTSNTSRSGFRLVPGSRRLLTPKVTKSPPAACSDIPPPTPTLLPKLKAPADVAVRGGSFFQSVFHKTTPPPPPQQLQHRKNTSDDGLHRRNSSKSSMDDLDTTLRRGHDKAQQSPTTSPKNVRFLKPNQDDGAIPPSLPNTPVLPMALSHHTRPTARSQISAVSTTLSSITPKKAQSTDIKKAFTEFHNSSHFAQDSTSAYLGDEPSAHQNNFFAQYNQMASNQNVLSERISKLTSKSGLSRSVPLATVTEDIGVQRSLTMLKTIQGPESWQSGRRYLIAPAVLSACPLQVLSSLSGSAEHHQTIKESVFGVIALGRATLTYIGRQVEPLGWSTCDLVLRQNYLLEYDIDAGMQGIPRGVAHLSNSRAYPGEFSTTLELEFYGSPCAKSDKRVLMIRLDTKEERERWITCFNDAAQLTIGDFYKYNEESPFGRGRYAAVYPARRLDKSSDEENEPNCAIKVIDKNEFWKRVVKGMERADTLVRESSVQATLTAKCGRIPSFLQIRSFFETPDHIVMELELLEGNDLFRFISSRGTLDEIEAANIMKDILTSLESMCRIGLAHRDIKPANILMGNKLKDGVHVKVGDFGMSTFVGVDGLVRGRCGTPGYVAPEIFSAGIHGGYGNKVDVFSAGVTLYVMLCGYEPFYGESDAELIAANKEAEVDYPEGDWRKISKDARDLVEKMLMRHPHQRISAKEALQHPWIINHASGIDNSALDTSYSLRASDISKSAACTIS